MQASEAVLAHSLHRQVIQLTPSGMVRQDALEYFEKHIELLGQMIGCFAQERLVAYGVLGLRSPMLSLMTQLLDVDPGQHTHMCLLDGASCAPDWRGRRLHEDAIALRIAMAEAAGRSVIAVTVAPTNLASLRGLLRRGFVVARYAQVYGGLPRLVLSLDINCPRLNWQRGRVVASADLEGHRDALSLGLLGYGCEKNEQDVWAISYGYQAG
ncbi:MAG TPA: hypothetical protein VF682_06905 [Pseudomonas sp.]|jgi:hypothetical protein